MLNTIEIQTSPPPKLSDLIKEASTNGEITLTDGGNAVAKIVPLATCTRPKPKFGSAKAKLSVPVDFDAPLDDLKDYL